VEPKRLALLAYLAVGRAGGAIPRGSLMTVFWPELSEGAARSALRQAIHHLGERLGRQAITGRGTDRLGIDPHHVRCDLLRFEEALDTLELARAMRYYRGEFLAGPLFSGASHEFLEWVERERARISERALDAAIDLSRAEERRGNTTGQIHWIRRALEIEPFREDLFDRMLDLYEKTGRRNTAIHAIRTFRRMLNVDYGVPLPPALRQRLRSLLGERPDLLEPRRVHDRMHALQGQVQAEVGRTADLVRQLQALAGARERPVD
jgi:DNA-binding SARP family transcriptional activator